MDIRWRSTPSHLTFAALALRTFQAYLYTVVTIATGAQPHTVEASIKLLRCTSLRRATWTRVSI